MILMSLFLVFIGGFWKKTRKLKSTRSRRCACHPRCPEHHMECPLNSEVWNSILILSCLSALLPSTEAYAFQQLDELQKELKNESMKHLFENSSGHLYTPNITGSNDCTDKFFDCFLMEWIVFLHDERPDMFEKHKLMIQSSLNEKSQENCSEENLCEKQELAEPHIFYEKILAFIQKQITDLPKK